MIKDILRNNIQKIDDLDNWKEAIYISCKPLIREGSIKEGYAKDIINNVEKNGPYIVLDDGFALPHAQRGENVTKTAMSYLYVKNGVDLMGNIVYSFLTLAVTDNDEHINALEELSVILDQEENMKKLLSGNIEEIF